MSYKNVKTTLQLIRDITRYEQKTLENISDGELQINEINVIACLYRLIKDERNTSSVLGKELSMSPSGISNILKKLDKKGYCERVHDTTDRRKVFVFPIGKSADINDSYIQFYNNLGQRLKSEFNNEYLSKCNKVLKSIERYTN